MTTAATPAPAGAPAAPATVSGIPTARTPEAPAPAAPAAAPAGAPAAGDALAIGAAAAAPAADKGIGKPVEYDETGDAGLDLALEFVGGLGFGPDTPAMKAFVKGDFGIIKAQLEMLGDKAKGWERMLKLAESSHERNEATRKDKVEKDTKTVHEAAGGEEQWKAIQAFVGQHADAAELKDINAALKKGGTAAKAMAVYLRGVYERAGTGTKEPAAVTKANAAGGAAPASGALSPRAYTEAVAELNRKSRGRLDGSPEYAALKARRAMWRG